MREKDVKGITLIALVITIIILLILAGISIATLTGENGILTKADTAKKESNKASAKEKIQLALMSYQIDKEKTTVYDELIKIDGLTYITPDNRNDGPQYNVIVDGYEFIINEDLSIEYVGEEKEQVIPEITKVDYETGEVEELTIEITAKTEDKAGLKEIRVSRKKVEDSKTIYETVKIEKVTGKEVNIEVDIPINGEYVIEAIGANNQIGKKEITISNIKEGSILATITIGTMSDQAQVALNIKGEAQKTTIKSIELYVADQKVKTYEYTDLKTIREETYTINNLEFYKTNNCYVKVIDSNNKETFSEIENVMNTKIIATIADLENLATQVNNRDNTFENRTLQLIDNITTGENWIPIGYLEKQGTWTGKYFAGTFEGNKHTVTIKSSSKNTIYKSSGLFGFVSGGNINNLIVDGTIDAKCEYIGGILGGVKDGIISNCNNNATITDTTNNNHGGITGVAQNSTIQNCTNTNTIYGNSLVGGICGQATNSTTISKCSNSGLIKCYGIIKVSWGENEQNYGIVGGICGGKINDTTFNKIENCINIGEVTGNVSTIFPNGIGAGGIIGWATNIDIITSKNKGKIHYDISSGVTSNGGALGGIAGGAIKSTVNQCFNTNTITSKYNDNYGMNNVGGIVGYNISSTIKNTYNIGSIYGNNNVGGIVGNADIGKEITGNNYVSNNYNASETVNGKENVGNYAGRLFYGEGDYHSSILDQTIVGASGNNSFTNYKGYTLTQMKTLNSGLLTLLSNGDGNAIWAQEAGKNSGLPYLVNNQP